MSDATPGMGDDRDPDASWFEEWFATDFYLKLYSHRDVTEAESCVDLILGATGLDAERAASDHGLTESDAAATLPGDAARRRPRALDLACGPGRHAIALARRGFDVTAVDLSPTLLRHARAEAAEAGVAIEFLESDMRAIEFDGDFDLGVQLFTSFGYFDDPDDDMLVLRHMRHSLRTGGYYALDLINEEYLRHNLVEASTRSLEGILALEERWIADGRVNKRISIPPAPGATRGEAMSFVESVRLFSPETIARMLAEARLEPVRWCGDYDGSPYDQARSKRMIVVSRAV